MPFFSVPCHSTYYTPRLRFACLELLSALSRSWVNFTIARDGGRRTVDEHRLSSSVTN